MKYLGFKIENMKPHGGQYWNIYESAICGWTGESEWILVDQAPTLASAKRLISEWKGA